MVTTRSKRTLEEIGEEAEPASLKPTKSKQKRQKFNNTKSKQDAEPSIEDEASLKDTRTSKGSSILVDEDESDGSVDVSQEGSNDEERDRAVKQPNSILLYTY